MINTEVWEYIKDFYKAHFGLDNWVVEMFANRDILLLCASGSSNSTISEFLDIDKNEIELVIKEAFGFSGWDEDLPCNPFKLYRDNNDTFSEEVVVSLSAYPNRFENVDMFLLASVCDTMLCIEERLQDEWNAT